MHDLAADVTYFDVTLAKGRVFEHTTGRNSTAFAYAIEGSGHSNGTVIKSEHCALFGKGESVTIGTQDGCRFLFVSGEPLNEPVAWGGPIVMNSEEELATAFRELEEGTFIKAGRKVSPSTSFYRV